jgi:hypothetical protein
MKIDNFDKIAKILSFETPNDFYFIQVIPRKKDGNDTNERRSNVNRAVRTYYIFSVDDLLNLKDNIIEKCRKYNARAYINLNRRNAKHCVKALQHELIDLDETGNYKKVFFGLIEHVVGSTKKGNKTKYWIVDVDTKDLSEIEAVIEQVDACRSGNSENLFGSYLNVRHVIETPNGFHLITNPFNLTQLPEGFFKKYELKKDNPTILYYEQPAS